MEQSPPPPRTDPNDLLIFARVADLGSLSGAARRLGLPKSTVSRRLAALEQRMGERLIQRTTRRQSLTEFGLQMLEHAHQVAAEVDAVDALGAHRQAVPGGRLRVSMPSDLANLLLADTLAAFVGMHPRIQLELDLSPRRVDILGEGYDLAVRMGTLPDDAYLAARRLASFSNSLYAAPAYLAERGDPHHPDDLARHACVRLLGNDREPASWSLRRDDQLWVGVPPGPTSANAPEMLLRLVQAGVGIAALPDFFAHAAVRAGALRKVLPAWSLPAHTAWAVFPGRRLLPARTRVFIDMLLAAFAAVGTELG